MDLPRMLLALASLSAAVVVTACDAEPAETIPAPLHCSRPSSVACEQPAHRQDRCVCDADAQCESGFCGLDRKYCARVCLWNPIEVALGDLCDCQDRCGTGSRCLESCPAGAYCKDLGLESRCARLEEVSGPCVLGYPGCKDGLWCDAGTCRANTVVGEGKPCGDHALCEADLMCKAEVCVKKAAAGATCSGAWECQDRYAACEPCSSGSESYCCTVSRLGASCTTPAQCGVAGLYCSKLDGTCRAVHALGDPCDPADSAEACPSDLMTRLSSRCDPATKTCVGGYCQ